MYWNARGGSSTDGGAFLLNVVPTGNGNGKAPSYKLQVTNKFGAKLSTRPGQAPCDLSKPVTIPGDTSRDIEAVDSALSGNNPQALFEYLRGSIGAMDYDRLRWLVNEIADRSVAAGNVDFGITALTLCIDRRFTTGNKKRSSIITICRGALNGFLTSKRSSDSPVQAQRIVELPGTRARFFEDRRFRENPAHRRERFSSRRAGLRRVSGRGRLSLRVAAYHPL